MSKRLIFAGLLVAADICLAAVINLGDECISQRARELENGGA